MQALPRIIETPEINIKQFLSRDQDDDEKNKVSLEQLIENEKRLPKKGSTQSFYKDLKEQTQEDLQKEIVDLIFKKDQDQENVDLFHLEKLLKNNEQNQANNFELFSQDREDIQFSYINFFQTTLQMKIDRVNKKQSKTADFIFGKPEESVNSFFCFKQKPISEIRASELFIARLICKSEIQNILEYKTIQKIIGRQFSLFTQKGLQKRFKIYFLFFFTPYAIAILVRNQYNHDFTEQNTAWAVLQICRSIAGATQVYFFQLETYELILGPVEYFKTSINFAEFIQFFLYFSHLILDVLYQERHDMRNEAMLISNSYIEVLLVIQAIIKLLELLSSFNEYQMLVVLIFQVIKKLTYFLIVYFLFVIEFTVMLLAAEGSFQLDRKDDGFSVAYPNFPRFIETLMTVFRFSTGAQESVQWTSYEDSTSLGDGFQSALVWFIFVLIQLVLQIVILNFVIAQINDDYEKIKSGLRYYYKMVVEQNMIFLLSKKLEYHQILIIQSPVTYLPSNVDEDDFETISTKIMKNLSSLTSILQEKIEKSKKEIERKCDNLNEAFQNKMQEQLQPILARFESLYKKNQNETIDDDLGAKNDRNFRHEKNEAGESNTKKTAAKIKQNFAAGVQKSDENSILTEFVNMKKIQEEMNKKVSDINNEVSDMKASQEQIKQDVYEIKLNLQAILYSLNNK